MENSTDIANQALVYLGSVALIQNLETDTSKESRVMQRLYWNKLKSLLSIWAWPFATVFELGTLVSFWPTPEWAFAYQYPNGCLKLNRIWNTKHTDDIGNKIEFAQSSNASQRLILTNYGPSSLLPSDSMTPTIYTPATTSITVSPIPVLEFIQLQKNCNLMPHLFKEALAYYMAADAAPSLPGIGQVNLRSENMKLGYDVLRLAGAQNMNEMFISPEKRSLIEKAATGQGLRIPLNQNWNPVGENWNP